MTRQEKMGGIDETGGPCGDTGLGHLGRPAIPDYRVLITERPERRNGHLLAKNRRAFARLALGGWRSASVSPRLPWEFGSQSVVLLATQRGAENL